MEVSERYNTRPFLRLLEQYILRCIGELAKVDEQTLIRMTPKLQEIYGINADWWQIVHSVMKLPEDFSTIVAGKWKEELRGAKANLSAREFSMDVADQLVENEVN